MTGKWLPFLALLLTACQLAGGQEIDRPIKVLIVDGFSNHHWQATTGDILRLLQRDKSVTAEVSTVPAEKSAAWETWLPDFPRFDVVIQNTNDISKKGSWPRPAQKALESYLGNGGGMLVFHSANNAFPQWKEYNRMIGLGWRNKDFGPAIQIVDGKPVPIPAGEGAGTRHGPRVDALITRIGEHPIHRNLPAQWLAADLEIYSYARGPAENLTVLSYAREPKTGLNFPIEWVVAYGKGRVYNSTYGHHWHDQTETPPGIRCVAFQTIFNRAVRWLAKRPVDPAVPANFPTADRISLSR
ncbi:MAG: ThuA domain-containing protein [Verrucomicrobiales bacterium]|nr:ThuA domain-containing protein [Verrucomicrobiota bacterium JB025]